METLETNPAGNGRYSKVSAGTDQRHKRRRRSSRSRTSAAEKQLIWLVSGISGLGGALAGCEPTGFAVINVVLTGGFAALVALAASRARRWSWLVLAGIAVLGASGPWLVVSAVALVVGLAASLLSRRRVYGAVVGALVIQSLLRMPEISFPLGSTLVAAVAVAPVLVSGYWASPRRTKRVVHRSLLGGIGVLLLGLVVFGVAVGLAFGPAEAAASDAREGLQAVRDGKTQQATALLDDSSERFEAAHGTLTAWWTQPARLVPVLAQQTETLARTTDQGRRVTASAAQVTSRVNYESLRYHNGQVDLERIRQAQAPLEAAASTFADALAESQRERSPWALGPLQAKVDEFDDQLEKASQEATIAAEASQVLPGLLGGEGTRRYFVAFITPSEQRGLGGFMGNWAEITATDGKLELTRSGRASELGRYPGAEQRMITSDRDYASRYGRFRVGRFFQDVTLSPDLPTVAKVVGELYPQAPGGNKLDGMIAVDPEGLAALLELSGPISVDGLDTPLTSKNAVDILTKRQYTEFGDRQERADFLDDAGHKTFEKLIGSDLPGPRKLADTLDPAVEHQRLMFSVFDPKEQAFLGRLGATGAFPKPDGNDFFSVRTQNRGNNKIDMFLERSVDYRVNFDPRLRSVQASATITLKNNAPAGGLPDSIIGSNDQGLPPGTNALTLDFYTPHGLKEARVGGETTSLGYQRELGYAVYSKQLEIPPGASVTVTLDLFGNLSAGEDRYELTVSPQPSITPDHVVVTVDASSGYRFVSTNQRSGPALAPQARRDQAVWAGDPRSPLRLTGRLIER